MNSSPSEKADAIESHPFPKDFGLNYETIKSITYIRTFNHWPNCGQFNASVETDSIYCAAVN